MNLGAKKICVITSNTLCGNSLLTEIVTAIENGKRAKALCKAHNKAQKGSIMSEIWKCNEVLLFKEIEDFISYEARKEKEKEEKRESVSTATKAYSPLSCCTPSNTAPFIFLNDREVGGHLI